MNQNISCTTLGGVKMPINEYGFLGKDIKQHEDNLLAKYNEVFDFYEEFNHFLHKIHDKTGLKNDDFQGAMITRTFTKSLTTFQAIYKLFRHHFCNNAENLCRVLFEEMVNVCYCVLGINEAKRFYSLEIINALKIINEVNNPKNKEYFTESDKEKYFEKKSYSEMKKYLINTLRSLEVKDIFNKNNKSVAISLEERVNKIDSKAIGQHYKTFYRIASIGVHSLPDLMGRYLIYDENRLLKNVLWGPESEDCETSSIFASIHFMIISLGYIQKYFKHPKKEDISKFWGKTQKLGYKYKYFI